jgi:hypothetical protein
MKSVEIARDFGELLDPQEFLSAERKISGWACTTNLAGAADEAARLRSATVIVSQAHYVVNDAVLDKAPNLKMVANYGVGYDHIDVPACTRRGVWVSNTPDVLTESTADTALLLLLASCRKLAFGHDYVKSGQWRSIAASDEDKRLLGNSPEGKTLCLVGFGRIGQALARKCQGAFGMRVVFYDTFTFSAAQRKELDAEQLPLDEALRQADFVSVHANLTPKTTGLIGARAPVSAACRRLPPTAAPAPCRRHARVRPDEAHVLLYQRGARADRRRGGAHGGAARGAHRGRRPRRLRGGAAARRLAAARAAQRDAAAAPRLGHRRDAPRDGATRDGQRRRLRRGPRPAHRRQQGGCAAVAARL